MIDLPRIEVRAATFAEVDELERIIELIAVPYDQWATVEYEGRLIEESFAPGAFGAIDNRVSNRRFQVNIDHKPERWVGRVVGLHPDDPVGLRTELKVRRGAEGDQVLDDAIDGMYGASIGFGAYPRDQVWESRQRRRIVKAYLDHIALTPTPAYATAGRISVRRAPTVPTSATPNLDRILSERAGTVYPATV